MKKIISFIELHSLTFFSLSNILLIPIIMLFDKNDDMFIVNLLFLLSFWYYIKMFFYHRIIEIRS